MNDNHQYNIFSVRLKKKDGKLVFDPPATEALYNEFLKSLSENQYMTGCFEAHDGSGTNAQLQKIHACIREMSMEMGQSFKTTKLMIKEESGFLVPLANDEFFERSWANCSVQELGIVIESVIEAGESLGINFRGQFPKYLRPEDSEVDPQL